MSQVLCSRRLRSVLPCFLRVLKNVNHVLVSVFPLELESPRSLTEFKPTIEFVLIVNTRRRIP